MQMIDRRQYKNSNELNEEVSLLGYGCMRFPTLNGIDSDIDYEQAEKLIDYAYAHGVNYFDTAYMYHAGSSEKFIGKALAKYPRESFFLADKLPPWVLKTPEDVDRVFNEQLGKCGVEYFDYYLVHSLNAKYWDMCVELDVYNLLLRKKEQGLIKKLGFSFHDVPEVLRTITDGYEWDFAQIQLNYIDWDVQDAKQQYEILAEKDIPAIIMEPLHGGSLAKLCSDSAEILKKANPDVTVASWGMRYAASLPNVLTVLSGMSDQAAVEDNLKTFTDFKPLSESERAILDDAVRAYKLNSTIPCTSCRYCQCPQSIDIPRVFAIYNRYKISGNSFFFVFDHDVLPEENRPNRCTSCGNCSSLCPQAIDIPKWIKTVDQAVSQNRE